MEVVPESVSLPVLLHKICNFHIKYGMSRIGTTHVPSLHLTMSATIYYIQGLIKITSSIDAKIETHEGRNMASVGLHAQVQTGCVATKGTRLCLENASNWVFSLKWMQFSLHLTDLNYYFFQQYLHFERSSNFCSIYPICYTLLPWKPNKPDIFMNLKEWSHDVTIGKLIRCNCTAAPSNSWRDTL